MCLIYQHSSPRIFSLYSGDKWLLSRDQRLARWWERKDSQRKRWVMVQKPERLCLNLDKCITLSARMSISIKNTTIIRHANWFQLLMSRRCQFRWRSMGQSRREMKRHKEEGKIPVRLWVTWSLNWIVATIIEEDVNLEEVTPNSWNEYKLHD